MRRRGKDEGFHPHPGDPWHPGWAADEEPPPASESPVAESEVEETQSPETLAAGEEPGVAEPGEGIAEPGEQPGVSEPGDEAAEWAEILGVASDSAEAVPAAPGGGEGIAQSLFDFAATRPPAGSPPADGSPSEELPEPEPAGPSAGSPPTPPPWSADEIAAEDEQAEAPEEGWAGTPDEDWPEAAEEDWAEAAEDEQAGTPDEGWPEAAEEDWAETIPGSGPGETPSTADETQELSRVEEEAEVEDWLAFAAGPVAGRAGLAAAAEPPLSDATAPAGEQAEPVPPARRRFWSRGGRGRLEAETRPERPAESIEEREPAEPATPTPPPWSPDEVPDHAAPIEAQAPGAGETPAPRPPPWSPGEEPEEPGGTAPPIGSAVPPPEEAWGSVETAGRQPAPVEPEGATPSAESEEPPPPPWVIQSELDRAATIPVVPPPTAEEEVVSPLPGWEEHDERGEEPGWGEQHEPARPSHGDATASALAQEREREEAEAWEAFGGSALPEEASGIPGGDAPLLEAEETGRPTPDLIGEEIYAGSVTAEHRDLAAAVAAADTTAAQMQAVSAPMAGLESGVVGFGDVVEQEGEQPEEAAAARSDLPLRVITGLVLVALLAGAVWVGGGLLAGFIGVLAFGGVIELYAALRRSGHRPLALFGILGAGGLLAATWFYGLVAIPIAAVGIAVLSFFYYALASRRRDPLTNGSLTLLGVLWVAGPLAFAFPMVAAPHARVLVIALVATVVATDVGAYFAGRSWGARPLAPVLSPHKTVEGLAGGVVLGLAAAVLMGHFFEPLNLRTGAGLGLVVAFTAPLGDLAESMVKRSLGLKDMGSILPGHGGILDRIDAFLFVLPAVWVLYETLGLLR